MAKTLNTTLSVTVSSQYQDTQDLSNKRADMAYTKSLTLTTGTAASQADRRFEDQRTLAASATEDLDVATGGGLVDALGDALALAKIRAIIVYAAPGNTNTVDISRAAANGVPIFAAAGDKYSVRPGGFYVIANPDLTGIPVTAATADLITITNGGSGTAVTYDITIIGTSA